MGFVDSSRWEVKSGFGVDVGLGRDGIWVFGVRLVVGVEGGEKDECGRVGSAASTNPSHNERKLTMKGWR